MRILFYILNERQKLMPKINERQNFLLLGLVCEIFCIWFEYLELIRSINGLKMEKYYEHFIVSSIEKRTLLERTFLELMKQLEKLQKGIYWVACKEKHQILQNDSVDERPWSI